MSNKLVSKQLKSAGILVLLFALFPWPVKADGGASLVRWRSFDDSIFAEAKRDNKLVLLDLEAVWCHWCHVMDEKTYADRSIADILASKYICIKVDQDAQPDLSNKYEEYGWPATIIFDGDGREIAKRSGYINPEKMKNLLTTVIKDPTPEPDDSAKVATVDNVLTSKDKLADIADGKLPERLKQELIDKHLAGYDSKYGGWGTYQKFLDSDSVEYSLLLGNGGDKAALARAKKSLDGELNLLDPAFGGLYQYSTDGDWQHPHYEKIMQTQADGLRAYALAYSVYNDKRYLSAAKSIAAYLQDYLTAPDGAFYTSQDADLVKGQHSEDYFALTAQKRLKLGLPRIDKHNYSRENGWAITALAALYGASGESEYLKQAKRACDWVVANRSISGGGFSHDARNFSGPYLGDTLSMGRAFVALYQATADRRYLLQARACADFIDKHFRADSGFVTSDATASRVVKPVALLDENIILCRFANQLNQLTGEAKYRAMSDHALDYLATPAAAYKRKILVAGILLANREANTVPLHITVVGAKSDPQAQLLFACALKLPQVYKRIEWYDPSEGPMPNPDTELPAMPRACAFVCSDGRCSSPSYDGEALKKASQL
ncbi:MAG: thioredoxin domain-containing protein [Candidatus Obscuribacter sp.]|nr:thioredoxin domain-containing protein [Candidatus Obscuribacter sp.]MBP6593437.1 thioredoxin domain-containing protein [Candidatus Obscuribacter sp.]